MSKMTGDKLNRITFFSMKIKTGGPNSSQINVKFQGTQPLLGMQLLCSLGNSMEIISISDLYIFSKVHISYVLQILFRKHLSSKQWLSLILLTAGCMIKQIDFTGTDAAKISATPVAQKSDNGFHLSINLVFIFVQVCYIV